MEDINKLLPVGKLPNIVKDPTMFDIDDFNAKVVLLECTPMG